MRCLLQKDRIIVNLTFCKYPVVRDCVRKRGWKILVEDTGEGRDDDGKRSDSVVRAATRSTAEWDLFWQDAGNVSDRLAGMHPWQRINHWPGNVALCRKDGLARTMKRMRRVFPLDFDFVPRTWTLPDDWTDFQTQFPASTSALSGAPRTSKTTFIVKPAASSQGRGIYLTRKLDDVDPRVPSIAQRYISKPFLIDGLKFDMRIYVLVTSIDPLRIWLFDNGLCRFATSTYVAPSNKNFANVKMHLTNYAINKDSPHFVFNKGGVDAGSTGSKRTLTWFKTWLDENGFSSHIVFGRIAHMINKAIIASRPHMLRCFRASANTEAGSMQAFELFGLDVLLDNKLRPWLLESNMSPSLTCDTKLNYEIKSAVVGETMDMLRLRVSARKKGKAKELAAARQRLYGSFSSRPSSASASRPSSASASRGSERRSSPIRVGEAKPGKFVSIDGVEHIQRCVNKAEAISAIHQRHEIKTAKGFRLIYPLPHASEIEESVWSDNATAAAKMSKTMTDRGLSSPISPSESTTIESSSSPVSAAPTRDVTHLHGAEDKGAYDSKIEEDLVDDDTPAAADTIDVGGDDGGADVDVTDADAVAAASQTVHFPIVDGTPFPFIRPHDASKEDYNSRARQYHLYHAVAEELYATEERITLTSGRRAAESVSVSSASLIAAAVKAASGAPAVTTATSRSPSVVGFAPSPMHTGMGGDSNGEIASITRMLQAISDAKSLSRPSSSNSGRNHSTAPEKIASSADKPQVVVLSGIRADGSRVGESNNNRMSTSNCTSPTSTPMSSRPPSATPSVTSSIQAERVGRVGCLLRLTTPTSSIRSASRGTTSRPSTATSTRPGSVASTRTPQSSREVLRIAPLVSSIDAGIQPNVYSALHTSPMRPPTATPASVSTPTSASTTTHKPFPSAAATWATMETTTARQRPQTAENNKKLSSASSDMRDDSAAACAYGLILSDTRHATTTRSSNDGMPPTGLMRASSLKTFEAAKRAYSSTRRISSTSFSSGAATVTMKPTDAIATPRRTSTSSISSVSTAAVTPRTVQQGKGTVSVARDGLK